MLVAITSVQFSAPGKPPPLIRITGHASTGAKIRCYAQPSDHEPVPDGSESPPAADDLGVRKSSPDQSAAGGPKKPAVLYWYVSEEAVADPTGAWQATVVIDAAEALPLDVRAVIETDPLSPGAVGEHVEAGSRRQPTCCTGHDETNGRSVRPRGKGGPPAERGCPGDTDTKEGVRPARRRPPRWKRDLTRYANYTTAELVTADTSRARGNSALVIGTDHMHGIPRASFGDTWEPPACRYGERMFPITVRPVALPLADHGEWHWRSASAEADVASRMISSFC